MPTSERVPRLFLVSALLVLSLATLSFSPSACAADGLVHGLWVWKSPTVLEQPRAAQSLLEFCKSESINEMYVSISERSKGAEQGKLLQLIKLLHHSKIRVEALLSSTEADEPGKHRDTLIRHVEEILEFNHRHPSEHFDGIHLDIEPQQRPENKCPGNLRFLPGLADAYRAVWSRSRPG
jgi:hypothetical protein